ncbi:MAG: bifunctional 2-C-methyl-D-erythritol 4-phosphate cytidylyltransferase/2-C-methyl-D-erythritol 2,4-cyclodiphosphate synthase [Devosia nanyangense]|uniref:Bifunctional enzyme IspD/IspF n=1 Tax=Devosia nanyangense TaxID=1228055 RepID=A0A933NWG0_9HYPH|nr:bifunctional 2-C-methyl-D-erythritol 4-phosphate cytidylyltransferase/2-C-methyl-D-erythritol 2,4-cyclodiphosphate synthase [Devosia nanyangense]
MAAQKTIAVLIVAAGTGERAGGAPKQYRMLGGKPVLARTVEAFLARPDVNWVLPVIHRDHTTLYGGLGLAGAKLLPAIKGAPSRQGSVLAGLIAMVDLAPDLVLIQDAARPLVDAETIDGVLAALESSFAALPVVPVTDTIKRSEDGRTVSGTEDRRKLFAAQTPQGFAFAAILDAHRRAAKEPAEFTDDAAIAEWAGLPVVLTKGSPRNIKLTLPEDFSRAERLLGGGMETRTGTGFDVHPFEAGDAVWLGGVRIPHTHRLKGHSDADAALHALTDAIYGALGEGDIGTFFPPSEPQWKGASSSVFLKHAAGLVAERGGRIVNLDLTIVCEAPRISPHVEAMKAAIAAACGITVGRVAVKATTSEKLGFTGRGEGLMAMATASIELPRRD